MRSVEEGKLLALTPHETGPVSVLLFNDGVVVIHRLQEATDWTLVQIPVGIYERDLIAFPTKTGLRPRLDSGCSVLLRGAFG